MGGYTVSREELKLDDEQSFDWAGAAARVEVFAPQTLADYPLAEFVLSATQLAGEEAYEEAEGLFSGATDRAALLALLSPEAARATLAQDLERLQKMLAEPEEFERPYDNYATFGFGYELIRLGSAALLRADACAEMVGCGTETLAERGQTPYETLKRLRLAGVSGGAEWLL